MDPTESPTLPSHPPVVWTGFDQHLIQAVLDFVNMESTPFKDTQGEHFWPFTGDLWVEARPEKGEQLFGTVWTRPDQGMLFLLHNNETFKSLVPGRVWVVNYDS